MVIENLLDLFVDGDDQMLKIYDLNEDVQANVFEGKGEDIPDEYLDSEIETIDNIGEGYGSELVINIDSSR